MNADRTSVVPGPVSFGNKDVPCVPAPGTATGLGQRLRRRVDKVHIGDYTLAVIATLLALLLRFLADPWLGDQSPYITFVVAVALTGLYRGVRSACVAAALSAVVAYFCFVPPRYEWGFQGMSDAVGFGVYLLAAVSVILLTHAHHRAVARAEDSLKLQVETTRKLLDAESLFRHFMDHSTACAYLRDEQGRCIYANQEAQDIFGIRQDPEKMPAPPGAGSRYRAQDQEVLEAGHAMQFLDKLEQLNDRDCYWLTSKFPFSDLSGRRFAGGISFEVTERMEAEEVLRKTERLSSAGQMASLLAHEINNPLAALTNVLFLLKDEPMGAEGGELLRQANLALGRINRIVRTTLAFYYESDTPAPVPIAMVVEEVASVLTSIEAFKHVQMELELDRRATVVGSPRRIRQLITSLLTNAVESGSSAVRIRVRLGQDWRQGPRPGVYLTVADHGHGIPQPLRRHLFEPFFTTKLEKGAGLGLWASKAIVLRNDGRIRLRSSSTLGRSGTCVQVFLPTAVEAHTKPGSVGKVARTGT